MTISRVRDFTADRDANPPVKISADGVDAELDQLVVAANTNETSNTTNATNIATNATNIAAGVTNDAAQDTRMDVAHNADGTQKAGIGAVGVDFALSGDTPTFVSAGVFTVPGDRTATYTKGRRLEINGPVYSTVKTAVFTTVTTITVEEGNVPAGITSVSFGITSTGTTGSAPKDGQVTTNFNAIEDLSHRLSLLEAATNPGLNPQDFFADTTQTDLTATTMDLANNSGQKDIQVASTVGFAVGDSIDLLHATDPTLSETVAITSIIAGDKLRSVTTLANSYPIGSFVKRSGTLISGGKLLLPTGAGDGRDGAVTISAAKNINTDILGSVRSVNSDGILTTVTANPTGTTITVASITGFADGDKLTLINQQGGAGDIADVGNYEVLTVSGTPAGSVITVKETIIKSYDGASFAAQKVTVQRIPQWTDVTIQSGGDLSCNSWNGTTGGILSFMAIGTVNVQTGGVIQVLQKGYRGGALNAADGQAIQGEGISGLGIASQSANIGGGGGAIGTGGIGGAGGGYGTIGQNAVAGGGTTTFGGSVYGDINLDSNIFLGSGGGGGTGTSGAAGNGGQGGGIIIISANNITLVASSISANGQDGLQGSNATRDGGGGSGGSIYIQCVDWTNVGETILATGGATRQVNPEGDGGGGRIQADFRTIEGIAFASVTTQVTAATNPDAGKTALVVFVDHKAARYRSIIVSRPQRMVSKIILFVRQNLSVFHTGITSNIGQDRFSGIIPVGDASLKYAIGDLVVFRDSAGFYVKKLDGNIFVGTVDAVDGVAGTIDVAEGIPSAESGARLERCDIKARASIVATGAAEAMAAMDLKVVEQEPGSIELLYEWHQIPAVNGQDSNVELALSTTDPAEQGNVYAEDYTSLLEFL